MNKIYSMAVFFILAWSNTDFYIKKLVLYVPLFPPKR